MMEFEVSPDGKKWHKIICEPVYSQIDQELVDKFNLSETDIQNGCSFINNVKLYEFQTLEGWQVFLSNGNGRGERLKDNLLCVLGRSLGKGKRFWFSFEVPVEVLKDAEVVVIKDMVRIHAESVVRDAAGTK